MDKFPVVDGFEPKEDLSHMDEQDLARRAINAIIWLAHERGHSIEETMENLLMGHRIVKNGGFFGGI